MCIFYLLQILFINTYTYCCTHKCCNNCFNNMTTNNKCNNCFNNRSTDDKCNIGKYYLYKSSYNKHIKNKYTTINHNAFKENKKVLNNEKLHLKSGLSINVPLNIIHENYNCAYLAVFRFFLSDNYFLDKILNKETSTFNNGENNYEIEYYKDEIEKYLKNDCHNKLSKLFKNILKKQGHYNNKCNNILKVLKTRYNSREILETFVQLLFYEKFFVNRIDYFGTNNEHFQSDIFIHVDDINGNTYDKLISTNEYLMCCNHGLNKNYKVSESIKIKLLNRPIKSYEICGIIGVCGELKEDIKKTDFVLILPVYDENDIKKGYVKYQFNSVSDVKSLKYWNEVDNFSNWKNPRPFVMIYKEKSNNIYFLK